MASPFETINGAALDGVVKDAVGTLNRNLFLTENITNKGAPNGYAPLTSDGLIDPLYTPNIAPAKLYLALPKDGSPFGAKVNAAVADAINHGVNALYLMPGAITAEVPINNPGLFDIIGIGRHDTDNFRTDPYAPGEQHDPARLSWGGGVKIKSPQNSTTGCLTAIGTNPNPGTPNGFVMYPRFRNIACTGSISSTVITRKGGPAKLVDLRNAYGFILEDISAHNDFNQAFYIENCWDSYARGLKWNACGFSDPHATTDNATVQGYTGRAFLPIETLIGRSLGVPGMEIVSPNTMGDDTSNNIRWENLHVEGNAHNAVPLLVRGGNGVMQTFTGCKIECCDGNVPMIVICDQTGFRFTGWVMGAGVGKPYVSYGGVTAGEAWSAITNPGLILVHNCFGPKFDVTMGYQNGGAPLQAFARFVNTQNPKIEADVTNGLAMLTPMGAAGLIYDGCKYVSAARNRLFAPDYLRTVAGANNSTPAYINGTTGEP